MGGLLVGDHLAWRHRAKYVLLSFRLEDIVIHTAVVDDTSVKFPWPSKKEVANGHRNDITLQSVFVCSDLEGNLYHMLDLDSAEVAKTLNFLGMWTLFLGQLELGAKFFTCEVMKTPSIDDDLDVPSIDAGLGMKDMASLVFFLVMLESQDLGDNKSGT